jgi:GH43 family beta-xylosidase
VRKAQLALYAVRKSEAAVMWRRANGGFEADVWFNEIEMIERRGLPFARWPLPSIEIPKEDEHLAIATHPGAVDPLVTLLAR